MHQAAEAIAPFTVYEFIRLGRFPHQAAFVLESDLDREIIARSAETTGVSGLLGRPLTELSGGELQLARIAHALAQNSRVILLDEPVSHLDIQHAVMIMDILWKLNREGTTVVTVLHDINIASDYSGRIVGMKEGRVFFNGTPGRSAPVRPGRGAVRHPLHSPEKSDHGQALRVPGSRATCIKKARSHDLAFGVLPGLTVFYHSSLCLSSYTCRARPR